MKIDDAELLQIIPFSIAKDETVQNVAKSLDVPINDVTGNIRNVLILSRIDELSEGILDALAWEYHMDIYDDAADIETKRNAVKTAIRYHRYKGTMWAVKEAAALASKNAEIVEWFDYGGKPYHFKAITTSAIPSLDELRALMKAMTDAKNVRSWMDGIEYKTEESYKLIAVTSEFDQETLTREIELIADCNAPIYIGIGAVRTKYVDIRAAPYDAKLSGGIKTYAVAGEFDTEVLYGD